jgi:hypothetical protein
MATTPIYNWSIPDNTDLVKNGALAIRTLGDAIDTTMATMTPKTIVDAKGDLVTATAADTPARLAVGANGETLVADSSTSTGLRYRADYAAGKNKIINGDFGIWQRGTTFSTANAYTSDRWVCNTDATFTVSQQTFTPGTAPVAGYEGQYFSRINKSAGGNFVTFYQKIEDVRTFAAQTITISFWAKVTSGTITNTINVAQVFGSGGSAAVDTVAGSSQTITTSWQRFALTINVPSISGKTIGTSSNLAVEVIRVVTSSAAVIDVWGVQVEAGSVATAFQTATGTIQGELSACQRYFYLSDIRGAFYVVPYSTSAIYGFVPFPVQMRVAPVATYPALTNLFNDGYGGSGLKTPTSIGTETSRSNGLSFTASGMSGLTVGKIMTMQNDVSYSAEL